MKTNANYCGIIFVGPGGSFNWATTPEAAAIKAARVARADWKSLYDMNVTLRVAVYDLTDHDGWYSEGQLVRATNTDTVIPVHSTWSVTTKNKVVGSN